ncbi:MAG: helix-turn-helix transcriptional regulator [Thermomicrobiales bacterium]
MHQSAVEFTSGYREIPAVPRDRDYVACIWQSFSGGHSRQSVILPDGCVDLIWQPGVDPFIAGPMTRPLATSVPPGTECVGIRFQPGVAAVVLGVSAADLRDLQVPLVALFPAKRRHPSLDRVVAGTETPTLDRARDAISALLPRAMPPDRFIMNASKWFAQHPDQLVTAFITGSGVSERQARRRFLEHVGYGPKTLQRILRMQRVLWSLSRPDACITLAQLALASGYADQAHLTREIVALTGQRPSELAAGNPQSAVADLFKTRAP